MGVERSGSRSGVKTIASRRWHQAPIGVHRPDDGCVETDERSCIETRHVKARGKETSGNEEWIGVQSGAASGQAACERKGGVQEERLDTYIFIFVFGGSPITRGRAS